MERIEEVALEAEGEFILEGEHPKNTISFNIKNEGLPEEFLRLDSKGFHYKGQIVEDAGEAYKRFLEWLSLASEHQVSYKYENAIRQALEYLGPVAPSCSGCEFEWNEAIFVLKDALGEADQPEEG